MAQIGLAFQEVPLIQDSTELWKDINLNSGAAQSTLQDIKLPETAGGYVYKNSHLVGTPLSNRFIYWRSNDTILELIESSLDEDLEGCHLRLNFQHTPLLDGISVHETDNKVIILVSTVSSVHRFLFPHPSKSRSQSVSFHETESIVPSIFRDISPASLRESRNVHLLNSAGSGLPLPHTSVTWLDSTNTAFFALAYATGTIQVICLNDQGISTFDVKQSSVMSRLWNGIVPSAMRGSPEGDDMPLSLAYSITKSDTYLFALCKDLRLRMWSIKKKECLLSVWVPEFCREFPSGSSWTLSGRNPCLQIMSCEEDIYLCVYISLPELSQFCIFKPTFSSGQVQLQHISSMMAPEHKLVDFNFTPQYLRTLWLDGNSEPFILCGQFDQNLISSPWIGVSLSSISESNSLAVGQMDPREAYMQQIFSANRFSASTIAKAISIFCRSADMSFKEDLRSDSLVDRVTLALENEIRSKVNGANLTDEEYFDLQISCWEKFYSYCDQYHDVGTKVLGLFSDASSGLFWLIRKSMLSFVRPCDPLECFMFSDTAETAPDVWVKNVSVAGGISNFNAVISRSLFAVFKCLDHIKSSLSEEMTFSFDEKLYHLQFPHDVVHEITQELQGPLLINNDDSESLISLIKSELKNAPMLLQVFEILLNSLDLSKWQGDEIHWSPDDADLDSRIQFSRILSGKLGADIVFKSLQQMVKLRYEFCRDLLFLQYIAIIVANECDFPSDFKEQLITNYISMTSTYTQGYFVIYWSTLMQSSLPNPRTLDKALRELSLIDLPDPREKSKPNRSSVFEQTVVQMFIREQGGIISRELLVVANEKHNRTDSGINNHLLTLRAIVAHFIWPISINMLYPEFLLSQCQYFQLQEYIRLLKPWCEWNNCSRLFLLANTHLALGEPNKAVMFFCEASKGIKEESFMRNKLLQNPDDYKISSVYLQYYLKVIQIFSYFELPDSIIRLAKMAITKVADSNDPNVATLWSLIFKHHLEMDHGEDSYNAMMTNPDESRRKDCLRQFLVVMFERGHLNQLIDFPLHHMLDDVLAILESKARSSDLMGRNYYKFLYILHIKYKDYRRAASAMYEYSSRLGQEMTGLEHLSEQACCLLNTLNCLHLVSDPKYAWIVKPVPFQREMEEKFNAMGLSPKRDYDGEEIQQTSTRKIEVLELTDINKEYSLVEARLFLLKKDINLNSIAATPLSAEDTVILLIAEGMFDEAISLSEIFGLQYHSVFEGLASRCVKSNEDFKIPSYNNQNESSSAFMFEDRFNRDLWEQLRRLLNKYEKPNQSQYHRTIAEKFLAVGFYIPPWLKHSYQSRNFPELLRVYLKYDMVEEAVYVLMDCIDNILNEARISSDVKNFRVWLPYTIVDWLFAILEEGKHIDLYSKLQTQVTEKLNKYISMVKTISVNIKASV